MLKLLICFTCVVIAVLCIWMQAGPYALIAGLLAGSSGGYATTFADLGTISIFLLPALWVFGSDPVLRNPKWKARMMPRLLAVLAACALGVAGYGWYQFSQPRTPRKVGGIREAAGLATFTPTDVNTDARVRGADIGKGYSIAHTKNGVEQSKETFIPLAASEWPSADVPVVLHFSDPIGWKGETPKFTGDISVVKKPVPYLLRKSHVVPESVRFGVFVNAGKKESFNWLIFAIMSGIGLIVIGVIWMRKRKEWSAVLKAG